MTKLYFPNFFFDETYRWHIFPLLKQMMSDNMNNENFQFVDYENESDAVVLPMSWNYYYSNDKVKEVLVYVNDTVVDKPIISFVFGDVGNKVPAQFKGLVLRTSGDKSKLSKNHQGIPVFIEDPLSSQYKTDMVFERSFSSIPTVGFCGLATPFSFQVVIDLLRIGTKNMLSKLGLSYKNPQRFMSTSYFRHTILSLLKNKSQIKTNFVIRNQYRAGVKAQKQNHSTTIEFFENIKNSDYVLCMRGAGNFSVRFYETLAMGRIPVFVNTDCLLPLEDKIDWEKHVVWVEYKDRHHIEEKIVNFHSKLDEISLNELFKSNRKLWENHLKMLPYFKTLLNEST